MGTITANSPAATEPHFRSPAELREILDRLLTEIDGDSSVGPILRAARVPHRLEITDLDVVLNVSGCEEQQHCLRWEFDDKIDWEPKLRMEMTSDVANSYLQGCESLAVAVARRRIHVYSQARAALSFLPMTRGLIERYRAIIVRDYPHLLLG